MLVSIGNCHLLDGNLSSVGKFQFCTNRFLPLLHYISLLTYSTRKSIFKSTSTPKTRSTLIDKSFYLLFSNHSFHYPCLTFSLFSCFLSFINILFYSLLKLHFCHLLLIVVLISKEHSLISMSQAIEIWFDRNH